MTTTVKKLVARLNALHSTENVPYTTSYVLSKLSKYNKTYGDDKVCTCGHAYYRHFDTYENMLPAGCKYCPSCHSFTLAEEKKKA